MAPLVVLGLTQCKPSPSSENPPKAQADEPAAEVDERFQTVVTRLGEALGAEQR